MPYLTAVETDELPLPSNPDYWVRMKRRATFGDSQEAIAGMVHMAPGFTPDTLTPEIEIGQYTRTLAVRLLTDWNLTDEHDAKLPITRESLDMLLAEDGDFIVEEAQKRLGRREAEKAVPFVTPSGRRSKGTK